MFERYSNSLAARLPFFYGYVMIPVAMLLQVATSPGQTFAFSAFTPSFRESFAMSDSQLTLAYMLGTFLAAFPLWVIGPLSDRFGLRGLSLAAIAGVAGTCLLASAASGWWALLLVFFLLRFLGQGTLSLLGSNAISMWFRSRVGRAAAVISIGTSIAFAWVPGLISDSIAAMGWRATYQAMAGIVASLGLPLVYLFFRNRPEDLGQVVDGRLRASGPAPEPDSPTTEVAFTAVEARRTRAFWIIALASTAWAMIGTGVVFYLFTICEQRGFEASLPSALFKTFGLSMLVAQLGGGVLADFLRLNRMFGCGIVMLFGGVLALLAGESALALHAFSFLYGAGQGLLLAVTVVVWVRYYGRPHLGAIRGSVWSATVAGSGCGPLLMGLSQDYTGGFTTAITGFACLLGLLSIVAWFATQPVRQIAIE